MARNYAAIPYDYLEEMADLNDAEFGRLVRAVLVYSSTGEAVALSGNERFLFRRAMMQEDRFRESYDATTQAKSKAGKAGAAARAKARTGKQGSAEGSNAEQEETDHNRSKQNGETETESESKTESDTLPPTGGKSNKKASGKSAFVTFAGGNQDLLEALQNFEKMRNKIKKPMTDRAKQLLVSKLSKFPQHQWISILDQSITHCWQDIYELKDQQPNQPGRSPMDDLRQLHELFSQEE